MMSSPLHSSNEDTTPFSPPWKRTVQQSPAPVREDQIDGDHDHTGQEEQQQQHQRSDDSVGDGDVDPRSELVEVTFFETEGRSPHANTTTSFTEGADGGEYEEEGSRFKSSYVSFDRIGSSGSLPRRGMPPRGSNEDNDGVSEENDDGGIDINDPQMPFHVFFYRSRGPKQLFFLLLLSCISWGSTIPVVPVIVTERYARLHHNYTSIEPCSVFHHREDKPPECVAASYDAQNSKSWCSFFRYMFTFFTASVIGSMSDVRGRRTMLLWGIFLDVWSPLFLLLLLVVPTMDPGWYYASESLVGLVAWYPLALSSLADVVPGKWRAPLFGLMTATSTLGVSCSPLLALMFTKTQLALISVLGSTATFCLGWLILPETLDVRRRVEFDFEQYDNGGTAEYYDVFDDGGGYHEDDVNDADVPALAGFPSNTNHDRHVGSGGGIRRRRGKDVRRTLRRICHTLLRPFREMSILNRSPLFRLLASLSLFTGMVFSADKSLETYYAESQLNFTVHEIAILRAAMGGLTVLVLTVVLRQLVKRLGEKVVVVMAYTSSMFTNVLYGLARVKGAIVVAGIFSSFAGMSFPTISAIKSNNVPWHEQGRVQGALYSVVSLSSALGPVVMQAIFHSTKERPYPGPGTMFLVAGMLQMVAMALACRLPRDQTDSTRLRRRPRGVMPPSSPPPPRPPPPTTRSAKSLSDALFGRDTVNATETTGELSSLSQLLLEEQ